MQKNRRVHPVTLALAFAVLIALLFGMAFAASRHGDRVDVGLVPGPQALGMAHMLNSASPHFEAVLYKDNEVILRALDNKVIDAALLPVDLALVLPEDTYAIHGVLAVTDLLAVSEEETVANIGSLSGRMLILPQGYENSAEEKMLLKLLEAEKCAGYTLVYAADPAAEQAGNAGSVMLLPPAAVDGESPVRFNLSRQWRTAFQSDPPAGYCVVYRREIAGTGTFISFENALRDSMLYADSKTKKTVAMAVEAGLTDREETAGLLIGYMSFGYPEGAEMEESIRAFQELY